MGEKKTVCLVRKMIMFISKMTNPNPTKKGCQHNRLKVIKHKGDRFDYYCLHCLDCPATWSDPTRALSFLRKKGTIYLMRKEN